jgi:hypothetical protein
MPILDEERVLKTLKGEDIKPLIRVHSNDLNIIKGAFSYTNNIIN